MNSIQSSTTGTLFGHPKGLFVCFLTEMWERFSYYGMRALLILYLTKHWKFTDGHSALIYGAYTSLVYIMPVIGGMLADRYLGSRKAVTFGAILLILGHFGMAFEGDPATILQSTGEVVRDPFYEQIFFLSMAFIIGGVGFLKPNISTIVGSLYPQGDARRDGGFTIFYMGINLGSLLATAICGYLGETYGWAYGFGAAGIGMVLGLIIFLMGQKHLNGVAEPSDPAILNDKISGIRRETWIYISGFIMVLTAYILVQNQEVVGSLLGVFGGGCVAGLIIYTLWKCDKEERERLTVAGILTLFSMLFWALFEQAGSSLTLLTDRGVDRMILGWEIPASMFQMLNPFFILTLGPVFAWTWVRLNKKGIEPSIPTKFALGILFVGLGFIALVNGLQASGDGLTAVYWIVALYLLHTIGELCLSPVGLSMVTKLAPARIVGFMMGVWFLSSAAGNFVASLIAAATSSGGSAHSVTTFSQEAKLMFIDVYQNVGIFAIGIAVVLLLLSKVLQKWMHGVN